MIVYTYILFGIPLCLVNSHIHTHTHIHTHIYRIYINIMHLCNISGAAPIQRLFSMLRMPRKSTMALKLKIPLFFLSLFFEKHTYETIQIPYLTKSKTLMYSVHAYDIYSSVHRHRLHFPHNHINF